MNSAPPRQHHLGPHDPLTSVGSDQPGQRLLAPGPASGEGFVLPVAGVHFSNSV